MDDFDKSELPGMIILNSGEIHEFNYALMYGVIGD